MRTILTNTPLWVILLVWSSGTYAQNDTPATLRPRSSQDTPKESKPADQQVTGTVVDRDGKPIDEAEVIFEGPKSATDITDSNGHFTFKGPPGDYTITVRSRGRSQRFDRKIEGSALKPNSTLVIEPEALMR